MFLIIAVILKVVRIIRRAGAIVMVILARITLPWICAQVQAIMAQGGGQGDGRLRTLPLMVTQLFRHAVHVVVAICLWPLHFKNLAQTQLIWTLMEMGYLIAPMHALMTH